MSKHILFILTPGFYDGEEGPFFCPHSAAMEGLLKYIPELQFKAGCQKDRIQKTSERYYRASRRR